MELAAEHKKALLEEMRGTLDRRILEIQGHMEELREAGEEDTKSSAGDKYETGREMLQIEMNKHRAQMEIAYALKKALSRIEPESSSSNVDFGSIVVTQVGTYFISVGMGQVVINTLQCYALSLASPLGQALKGARAGDKVYFKEKKFEIISVV